MAVGCGEAKRDTIVLTVRRGGEADSVRVFARADLEPWADVLPSRDAGEEVEYTFESGESYSYALRCRESSGRLWIYQVDATPAEARAPIEQCNIIGRPQPSSIVIGTVVQPGQVAVGGTSTSGGAMNWSFTLPANQGLVDVLATSSDRVLLLSDVEVGLRTDLGTLNLDSDGVALEEFSPQLDEVPAGTASVAAWVTTARGTILDLPQDTTRAVRVPAPDVAHALGRVTVEVRTSEVGGRRRGVARPYSGGDAAYSLLPALSDAIGLDERTGSVALDELPPLEAVDYQIGLADFDVSRFLSSSSDWISLWNRERLNFDLPSAFEAYVPGTQQYRFVQILSAAPDGTFRWSSIER